MSSHVFIALFLLLGVNFLGVIYAQNQIDIDMGDNITTDLQSYLNDLHVAVSSVQYTANMSTRMLAKLMDKVNRNEVKCQCGDDENPRNVANMSSWRLDYRRTSPIAAHKLHIEPLKWNDARKSCKLEGAELATLDSINEGKILGKILYEAKRWSPEVNLTESAFMGVHSHFETNDWVTVRGDPVPGWWSVVSNNSIDRCAVLTVHSNLHAANCNQARPYLCELRLIT